MKSGSGKKQVSKPVAGTQATGSKTPASSVVKTKNIKVKSTKSLKTISLKGVLSGDSVVGQTQTKASVKNTGMPVSDLAIDPAWNNTFTNEDLRNAWLKMGRSVEQKYPRLSSIILNHIPIIKEGNVLELSLKNITQDNEIKADMPFIIQQLRYYLKNAGVQIKSQVLHVESNNETKAYTSAEKVKLMLKKNPFLLELTNKFKLFIE